jgi:hypothetical protein
MHLHYMYALRVLSEGMTVLWLEMCAAHDHFYWTHSGEGHSMWPSPWLVCLLVGYHNTEFPDGGVHLPICERGGGP